MTGDRSSAPPILEFTLRVLDAPGLSELAAECARGMVELFGCRRAIVRGEERTWVAVEGEGAEESGVAMAFRLSGAREPAVTLELVLESGPDIAVFRQQFVDLVAIVRRAWRDRCLLLEERRRAREDALTGLDNRRGIEEYLEHAINTSRHTQQPLTVMIVDLDHFKEVNDRHGHVAGDDVLQLAATCLREHLRPTDKVCRWGGDEFLIACPGLPLHAAAGVAERLQAAFASQSRARGATMSVGLVEAGAVSVEPLSAAALIALADEHLYRAKRERGERTRTPRATG